MYQIHAVNYGASLDCLLKYLRRRWPEATFTSEYVIAHVGGAGSHHIYMTATPNGPGNAATVQSVRDYAQALAIGWEVGWNAGNREPKADQGETKP